jgi:uroporphyrinogen decarboxylase
MTELKNDRFLRALRREPTDTTPIWVMRQAGRYLPEYRATRGRAGSFMALAQNPELACEVTLQPLERFELDAAILFSDILTIPDAMGLGLSFAQGEGPRFSHPVRTRADVETLAVPDMDAELRYVMDAVRLIRKELDGRVPLIGFSGSPWTLACYMVEGRARRISPRSRRCAGTSPSSRTGCSILWRKPSLHYLIAQAAAGAQTLMVFDTWGGLLGPAPFREFSLRYMAHVVDALKASPHSRDLPIVLFSKGAGQHLAHSLTPAALHSALIGPSTSPMPAQPSVAAWHCRATSTPRSCAPTRKSSAHEARAVLDSYGNHPGHVFNLGHGITPEVDPEHVKVLVDEVHAYGRTLRS